MRTFRIHEGDALVILKGMPDASVDAVVTDSPYGLGFMGKKWDTPGSFFERQPERGNTFDHVGGNHNPTSAADAARTRKVEGRKFQEWCEVWATECLRVLKPGGRMLAFGGPRTSHRLTCGIEDAGFVIEDAIEFFFGAGGVAVELWETLNDSQQKALAHVLNALSPDGGLFWLFGQGFPKHKSKLKPAYEPVVVARKGGASHLNIDACRIETPDSTRRNNCAEMGYHGGNLAREYATGSDIGRWPANIILDEEAAAALDEQSGTLTSGRCPDGFRGEYKAHVYGTFANNLIRPETVYGDSGGASRFFYCPKADRAERDAGLDGVADRRGGAEQFDSRWKEGAGELRCPTVKNHHPTVKPLSLMCWLVRLVTPEGGTVLDPFTGSGSTGIAALREGFSFVGIERESEYVEIARRRILGDAPLLNREEAA